MDDRDGVWIYFGHLFYPLKVLHNLRRNLDRYGEGVRLNRLGCVTRRKKKNCSSHHTFQTCCQEDKICKFTGFLQELMQTRTFKNSNMIDLLFSFNILTAPTRKKNPLSVVVKWLRNWSSKRRSLVPYQWICNPCQSNVVPLQQLGCVQ